MIEKITTRSEQETIEIAQNIEAEKFPNMLICLEGDLGSGKTIFAKGFANALGIEENITSPTFTIIKEYKSGEMPLYHMDAYRLEGIAQDLGFDEYYEGNGLCIVEWPNYIEDQLPKERLEISILRKVDGSEESRCFEFEAIGDKYKAIMEALS